MAESQQLINQAKSGNLFMQGLREFAGKGTPNITQPTPSPEIEPTNIRPDVPEEQAPQGNFLQGLQAFAQQQAPQKGSSVAETKLYSPEELAEIQDAPSVFGQLGEAAGDLGQAAMSAGRGVVLGISEVMDLAVEGMRRDTMVGPVANFVASKIKGSKVDRVKSISKAVDDILPGKSKEFHARVAEEFGKAIPSMVGGGAAAMHYAKTGSKAPLVLRGMVDDLARLGKTGLVKLEAGIAAIGGLGGEVAVEASEALGIPISDNTARMAGSLLSTLGPMGTSNLIKSAKARSAGRPTTDVEKARVKVGRALTKQAPKQLPEFENLARKTAEIEAEIPGLRFGLAEATQEPGFQRFTTSVIGQVPEIAQAARPHIRNEAKAIRSALNAAETRLSPDDMSAIPKQIEAHISKVERDVADQINQASAPVRALEEQVQGFSSTPALEVRQAARDSEFALKSLANEMFGKVGEQIKGQKLFNINDAIGNTIRTVAKQKGRFTLSFDRMAERSTLLNNLKATLVNPNGNIITPKTRRSATFDDVRGIIVEANEEIQALSRRVDIGQGDRVDTATLGALRDVRRAAQTELDKINSPQIRSRYPGLSEEFSAAKETFKEAATDVRSKFFKQLIAKDTAGQQTIDDSVKFGDKLLQSPEKTQGYLRVMGGFGRKGDDPLATMRNPQAIDELTRHARQSFMDFAVRNGEVNSRSMSQWLNRNKGIKHLPELHKELSNVKTAQEMVENIQRQSGQLLTTNDREILSGFLRGADPDTVIEEILAGSDPVKNMNTVLRATGGDEAARRGIGKSLWNHALRRTEIPVTGMEDIPILNPKAVDDFTSTYAPVLDQVWDSSHRKQIDVLKRASSKVLNEAKDVIRPSGNATIEKQTQQAEGLIFSLLRKTGQLTRLIPNRTIDIPYSVGNAVQQRVINSFSERETAAMIHAMKEAIFDPQAARLMMDAANKPQSQVFLNRLANYSELHSNAISSMTETMQAAKERQGNQNQ